VRVSQEFLATRKQIQLQLFFGNKKNKGRLSNRNFEKKIQGAMKFINSEKGTKGEIIKKTCYA